MKNTQTIYERVKQNVKYTIMTGAVLYTLIGNSYILTTKTGHQSADLATGRSTPIHLEQFALNFLGFNSKDIIAK